MSGYGERDDTNKIYLTLKVKRGTEIDPHIEVRKRKGTKYEMVSDQTIWVEGKFAGIGAAKYEVDAGAQGKKIKDKIMITLIAGNDVLVVQSAMNSHARNIMNTFLGLFSDPKTAGKIGNIKISVYAKNGFANTFIEHNSESVGWSMNYDDQKKYHKQAGDGYTDYSELEKYFLARWLKLKTHLETEFPEYKERADAIAGDQTEAADLSANAPAEAPQTEEPPPIGEINPADEIDDLPF